MSGSFNLNTFLQEYKSYNSKSYTAAENGKAAMEQREIENAKAAVESNNLLSLTLSERFAELGIGKRVFQQLGDTAKGAFIDPLINPIKDYLDKYENIFNESKYVAEIQAYAKQMFDTNYYLREESKANVAGQKFVYDM